LKFFNFKFRNYDLFFINLFKFKIIFFNQKKFYFKLKRFIYLKLSKYQNENEALNIQKKKDSDQIRGLEDKMAMMSNEIMRL
jgi:hypothetical protein